MKPPKYGWVRAVKGNVRKEPEAKPTIGLVVRPVIKTTVWSHIISINIFSI
jgi:hypothetical protein